MLNTKQKTYLGYSLLWVAVASLSRLIPHPFNATAILSLSLWSCLFFPKWYAKLLCLLSLFISDCLLAYIHHYALFGTWSFFTYTGILLLTFNSIKSIKYLSLTTCMGILIFWLWTNFGVWLATSDLYPKTAFGLYTCYVAALPFLSNNIIASLLYAFGLKWIYEQQFMAIKQP